YDNLDGLSQGVWIGKYPQTLINSIYSISSIKPTNEIEVAFLKWVLTDGQKFLTTNGYSNLLASERQRKLDMLMVNEVNTVYSQDNYAFIEILVFVFGIFIIVGFIVNIVVRHFTFKKPTVQDATSISPLVFDEDSVKVPKGLYFDKTHTWAFMEKDGVVRVGIDDFLQHITGPLTRIKMKNSGEKIKKGDHILSIIQNGKQLHINSPISGIISSQNETLNTNSSIMNSSPYSDGWVYMIEPTNWLREIQFLFMEKKYKEWLKIEFSRLKDFLAVSIRPRTVEYAHSVLQDGGELKGSILANLGPEVWEDFQTNFIDTSR
ncbi:glycine cleavage system protein H, partial [Bacteroidota bacterium]